MHYGAENQDKSTFIQMGSQTIRHGEDSHGAKVDFLHASCTLESEHTQVGVERTSHRRVQGTKASQVCSTDVLLHASQNEHPIGGGCES